MEIHKAPQTAMSGPPEWLEKLREDLSGYADSHELGKLLNEQLDNRMETLLQICTTKNPDPYDRKLAEYELGLTGMAQELVINDEPAVHDPYSVPLWLGYAQLKLIDFIAQDPPKRKVLERTPFFSPDPRERMRFCVSVSASIRPQANYDDELIFAAGVATDRIFCHTNKTSESDELSAVEAI